MACRHGQSRPGDVYAGGAAPTPRDRFGGELEVPVCPAPGDRGSELAVRLRRPAPSKLTSLPSRLAGSDPRQEVRTPLREAKALLEVGEIMLPDYPPTAHGGTAAGKLVGFESGHS